MKKISSLIFLFFTVFTAFAQTQKKPSAITIAISGKGGTKVAPKFTFNTKKNGVELFLLGVENIACFPANKKILVTHKNGGSDNYIVKLGNFSYGNYETFKEKVEKNLERGISGCDAVKKALEEK